MINPWKIVEEEAGRLVSRSPAVSCQKSKWQVVALVNGVVLGCVARGGFGAGGVGLAIRRLLGLAGGSHLHHLVGMHLGDIAYDTLLVGILAGAELAFDVHEVAFGVVALAFGDVVGQVAEHDDIVPVGLFDPVLVAVAIAFRSGQREGHFLVAVVEADDFGIATKATDEDDFVQTCHDVSF